MMFASFHMVSYTGRHGNSQNMQSLQGNPCFGRICACEDRTPWSGGNVQEVLSGAIHTRIEAEGAKRGVRSCRGNQALHEMRRNEAAGCLYEARKGHRWPRVSMQDMLQQQQVVSGADKRICEGASRSPEQDEIRAIPEGQRRPSHKSHVRCGCSEAEGAKAESNSALDNQSHEAEDSCVLFGGAANQEQFWSQYPCGSHCSFAGREYLRPPCSLELASNASRRKQVQAQPLRRGVGQ